MPLTYSLLYSEMITCGEEGAIILSSYVLFLFFSHPQEYTGKYEPRR